MDLKHLFEAARQKLSFMATMELIESIRGLKVSRLAFSENNIPWIDDLISTAGGHWEPAYAPFFHTPDQGKGSWSSLAQQTGLERHPVERSWQIYVSDDPQRAARARDRQLARQGCCNADLPAAALGTHAPLQASAHNLLNRAGQRLGMSGRSLHRVVRIARTLADLADEPAVGAEHLAEALQLRRALLAEPGRPAAG